MSEFTDLIIQVGETVGWSFVLMVLFTYQLFMPERFHPGGGTKLQRLMREPNEAVIAALEAVYEQHPRLSKRKLIEILNGDAPRSWDFRVEIDEPKRPDSE